MSAVLLGPTVSMDRLLESIMPLGHEVVLTHHSRDKAEMFGLPWVEAPSFADDPVKAAAILDERLVDAGVGELWPLTMAAFDLSFVKASRVHAMTTQSQYRMINNKGTFDGWLKLNGYSDICTKTVTTETAIETNRAVREMLDAKLGSHIKPTNGSYGELCWGQQEGADVLGSPDNRLIDPEVMAQALAKRELLKGPRQMLVSELLYGPELSVDALCIRGEDGTSDLYKWMVREKKSEAEQVVYSQHPVVGIVRNLVRSLGLHGVISVQFMYDKRGLVKLLEINLRLSGGGAAYSDEAMRVVGASTLTADWLNYMTGRIAPSQIEQWKGKVKLRLRTEARATLID